MNFNRINSISKGEYSASGTCQCGFGASMSWMRKDLEGNYYIHCNKCRSDASIPISEEMANLVEIHLIHKS